MKKYNKNAKLFYLIFMVLGFALLLLSVSYMTQYKDLFVYQNSHGIISGEGSENVNNNSYWATFINNVNGIDLIEELKALLGLPLGSSSDINIMSPAFNESMLTIRNCFVHLQNANWLIFYYFIVVVVLVAICFVFSNHSRRIYYKSNLIIGVLTSVVIIGFGIYVLVANSLIISELSENHMLLNTYNYVCNTESAADSLKSLDTIKNLNDINSNTIIISDALLALVIGYAAFMLVYNIRRYNVCEAERKDIIAKAVSLDE